MVSQGNIATCLRWDGKLLQSHCYDRFVKGHWKSVNIWRSYEQQ